MIDIVASLGGKGVLLVIGVRTDSGISRNSEPNFLWLLGWLNSNDLVAISLFG